VESIPEQSSPFQNGNLMCGDRINNIRMPYKRECHFFTLGE